MSMGKCGGDGNNRVFLLKVDDDIEVIGSSAGRVSLTKEEREYFNMHKKDDESFTFYRSTGVYRCGVVSTYIVCVEITDMLNQLDELKKKYIELENLERSRIRLAELVIHDVKNYVLIMDGLLTLFENGEYSAENMRDMREVLSEIKELFRKVAVIAQEKKPIKKEEIDLEKMISSIIYSHRIKLENKNMKYELKCKTKKLYTDPLIQEAIINLIDNAIEHSPENGMVGVKCLEKEGKVQIRVYDTGFGIPDDLKDIIFTRFKSSSSSFGMGLGLAVTKHIVNLLGGNIWVEDNVPSGAVFVIELSGK